MIENIRPCLEQQAVKAETSNSKVKAVETFQYTYPSLETQALAA